MTNEEAIKWVDVRMCWGRGAFTENHPPNIDECWEAGYMAIKALKSERESGEWIEHDPGCDGLAKVYECPRCSEEVNGEPTNFCPNCGAKMDGGKKEGQMTKPTVFSYKSYEDLLEENARLKARIMELVEINEYLKKTLFELVGDKNEDDNA